MVGVQDTPTDMGWARATTGLNNDCTIELYDSLEEEISQGIRRSHEGICPPQGVFVSGNSGKVQTSHRYKKTAPGLPLRHLYHHHGRLYRGAAYLKFVLMVLTD